MSNYGSHDRRQWAYHIKETLDGASSPTEHMEWLLDAKADAWDECVAIFSKNFFAGPTRDMVLSWLANPYRKE